MPAIDDDGFLLADSSAIIPDLAAKHPAPPLIPADPEERGRVIWWDEFGDTVFAIGAVAFVWFAVKLMLTRGGPDEAIGAVAD